MEQQEKEVLGRDLLKSMDLSKEQIDRIMTAHGNRVAEFNGNKAKLAEVEQALVQEKTTNQGLSDKFNSLFSATQELVQANKTLLEEQKKYQAEKTQAALQKAHDAAVEKSINSLDDSYDKTFFKNYFKNAEIDENGEIKNFKEEMDKFRNAYKPHITGGYKHIEATSIKPLTQLNSVTQEEFEQHRNDHRWLLANLERLEKAASAGDIHN